MKPGKKLIFFLSPSSSGFSTDTVAVTVISSSLGLASKPGKSASVLFHIRLHKGGVGAPECLGSTP